MLLKLLSCAVLAVAGIVLALVYPRLTWKFRRRLGYWPRLAAPRSLREKMQWRKIFDRNPLFVGLQDKLAAKAIVARQAPDQLMPAVLWSGRDPAGLPRAGLPAAFALKANHGTGFNLLVSDARRFDHDALVEQGRRFLTRRARAKRREWAYDLIEPQLFVEAMLQCAGGAPPGEYKVTVMGGRPVLIAAIVPNAGKPLYAYYTPDWERIPAVIGAGSRAPDVARPRCLDHMLATAAAVGRLVDMVRVDFYDVDGVDYFGECTIYSVSGLLPIRPREFDFAWGAYWDITKSSFFSAPAAWPLRLYRWALRTRLSTG